MASRRSGTSCVSVYEEAKADNVCVRNVVSPRYGDSSGEFLSQLCRSSRRHQKCNLTITYIRRLYLARTKYASILGFFRKLAQISTIRSAAHTQLGFADHFCLLTNQPNISTESILRPHCPPRTHRNSNVHPLQRQIHVRHRRRLANNISERNFDTYRALGVFA